VKDTKRSEKDIKEVDYKEKIIEMVEKINDKDILKRIYELAQYLYIHKEK